MIRSNLASILTNFASNTVLDGEFDVGGSGKESVKKKKMFNNDYNWTQNKAYINTKSGKQKAIQNKEL